MITGAAGSIGSEIVRQVAAMKAGHIVLRPGRDPYARHAAGNGAKYPDIKYTSS